MTHRLPTHTFFALLALILLQGCFLAARGFNDTKVDSINPVQRERLNGHLQQLDGCYRREIQRVDDGISHIKDVTDVIKHNCQGYYNTIKLMLYDEFGVGLGHAYNYSDNLKRSANAIIGEAIITKRRINANRNAPNRLLQRTR